MHSQESERGSAHTFRIVQAHFLWWWCAVSVCVCLRGDGRFCKLIFIDRVPCCCCSMTCSHRSRTLRPCSICRARSANFLTLERYLSLPNDLRKWQVKWLRWRQLMTAGSYDENRIWREFAWNLLQIDFFHHFVPLLNGAIYIKYSFLYLKNTKN